MLLKLFPTMLMVMASVVFGVPLAQAGLGIMPKQLDDTTETRSWFVHTLDLGESLQETVVINNHSDKTVTAIIEALDATSTRTGGYSLVSSVEKNEDIGNWVVLDSNRIVLAPHESREIGFVITVPITASVGEHSGGIAIHELLPIKKDGVNIQMRVAARIYITVPGKVVRDIEFRKVSYTIDDGQLIFNIQARNNSNVRIEPDLDITITGLFGSSTQHYENVGNFLSESEINIESIWEDSPPRFGFYSIKTVLHTGSVEQFLDNGKVSTLPNETYEHSIIIWVGPQWLGWLLLALIFIWIGYRAVIYIRDGEKYYTKVELYMVKSGDTLTSIVNEYKITPKLLLKFNKLSWTFDISPGDSIMIPVGRLTKTQVGQQGQMPTIWKYLITIKSSLYYPVLKNINRK